MRCWSALSLKYYDQIENHFIKKTKDITTKFKKVVSIALSDPQLTENGDCSNCQRLLHLVKEKIKNYSNGTKIQMLTLICSCLAMYSEQVLRTQQVNTQNTAQNSTAQHSKYSEHSKAQQVL